MPYKAVESIEEISTYVSAQSWAHVSARDIIRLTLTLQIQTKFTPIHGQDPANIPYDAAKPIPEQVETSITSSLHNFRLSDKPPNPSSSPPYIDCLVLHSPYPSLPETLLAWRAMESHVPLPVHTLGVSNIYSPSLLRALWDSASVKPSVVQNRFYADTGYDAEIREFCKEKGVVYQSFWTLTANPRLLGSGVVGGLAEKMGFSRAAALYGLVVGLGNVSVLDGTTRVERMKEDLESVEKIRSWAEENGEEWRGLMEDFRGLLR